MTVSSDDLIEAIIDSGHEAEVYRGHIGCRLDRKDDLGPIVARAGRSGANAMLDVVQPHYWAYWPHIPCPDWLIHMHDPEDDD